MKNYLCILLIIALFCLTLVVANKCSRMPSGNESASDTVIVTHVDTVKYTKDTTIYKLVPKYVNIVKRDTIKADTILTYETKVYEDTVTCANDSLILKSYTSGINSKLDSLKVDWRKQDKIITNTVTITNYVNKHKPIQFGLQFGVGRGLITNKFDVYCGFGASVNF